MKTKAQTKALLASLSPAGEVDELAITHYCEKTLRISASFSDSRSKESKKISFNEFKKWVEREDPEVGDIIAYDKTDDHGSMIAIIRYVDMDNFVSGCTWTSEGLEMKDNIVPCTGWRKPTDREKKEIKRELSIQGFEWNRRFGRIVEQYIPRNGDFLNLYKDDKLVGRGIIDELRKDGEIFMHCIKWNDKPAEYGLELHLGNISEYEFEICSTAERNALLESMAANGKTWNGYVKRIEPVKMRVEHGEAYWYINDRLAICTCHDTNGPVDKKRYISGNYFNDIELAHDFKRRAYEIILQQLCAPVI